MKFINRMRKDKKGFTLIEIIVVLVILAILAAFTIPSMLGFVNDARNKAALAEAREVYVAAQAVATESLAADATITGETLSTNLSKATATATVNTKMANYLGADIPAASYWSVVAAPGASSTVAATGKITSVTYTDASGHTNTITPN